MANPRIPPELLRRARDLRREMTFPERLLWSRLKGRQVSGFKFRKQHPIPPFIADFYCAEIGLILEIDGASHVDADYDAWQTAELERSGLHVVRITNDDVIEDLDGAVERVAEIASHWKQRAEMSQRT